MLRIRLARFGAKKKPTYRVVVIDQRKSRNSDCIEVVGHYNPVADPAVVDIKQDRVEHWMGLGAQPSVTVARLLKSSPKPAEEPAEAPVS